MAKESAKPEAKETGKKYRVITQPKEVSRCDIKKDGNHVKTFFFYNMNMIESGDYKEHLERSAEQLRNEKREVVVAKPGEILTGLTPEDLAVLLRNKSVEEVIEKG